MKKRYSPIPMLIFISVMVVFGLFIGYVVFDVVANLSAEAFND